MQIRITQNTLHGGVWHEPGIGNYSPELAAYFIQIGVAEPVGLGDASVEDKKKAADPVMSASLPARASRAKIATKRARSAKSSL